MSCFDRPENDLRRAALTLDRDVALWEVLLDGRTPQQLHRLFETTVVANGWHGAMLPIHPAWRELGVQAMDSLDRVDLGGVPPRDLDYAEAFFAATLDCWRSISAIDPAARQSLRAELEARQTHRIAQLATEPLPLGLPPQTLAARLPTLPTAGRDPREFTALLLRPLAPPAGSPPVVELELQLSIQGLLIHLRPCDDTGQPLRQPSTLEDSSGCTLLSATWPDLGLGETGPYIHAPKGARLGKSTDVRFVSGAQRAALLLCTQHDIVRVEVGDEGDHLSVAIACPGHADTLSARIAYLDRSMVAMPLRFCTPT